MDKRLIALLVVCLGIPGLIVVDRIVSTRNRFANAQLMNETSHDMMELTVATQFYSQENNGFLPPMQNPAVLQKALKPYAMDPKYTFISRASGKPFMPNAKMSGKTFKSASNNVVLFYDVETLSGPNNPNERFRVVGFADHSITMPEARWQREKADSGIR